MSAANIVRRLSAVQKRLGIRKKPCPCRTRGTIVKDPAAAQPCPQCGYRPTLIRETIVRSREHLAAIKEWAVRTGARML